MFNRNNLTVVSPINARRKKYNILFLCKDNTLLSIVAESILKNWSDNQFNSYSGGFFPALKTNSIANRYLNNRGLSTTNLRINNFRNFVSTSAPLMDFVIILDKHISSGEDCLLSRLLHGNPPFIDWGFSIPYKSNKNKDWQDKLIQQNLSVLEYRTRALSCIYMNAYSKKEQINRLNEIATFYPEVERHQYLRLVY